MKRILLALAVVAAMGLGVSATEAMAAHGYSRTVVRHHGHGHHGHGHHRHGHHVSHFHRHAYRGPAYLPPRHVHVHRPSFYPVYPVYPVYPAPYGVSYNSPGFSFWIGR